MPRLSPIKLTERNVQAAVPRHQDGVAADRFLWDRELRGFGLRVKANGKTKTWIIQYRRGSRQRRYALGKYPSLNAHEARLGGAGAASEKSSKAPERAHDP